MLFFILLASVYGSDDEIQFRDFMSKYNKSYSATDYAHRFKVFSDNLRKVEIQNKEHVLAGGQEVFGVTKFMDLTAAEFAAMYLTARENDIPDSKRIIPQVDEVAITVDWRTKGAVTPVKDQGQCGSCWAFSAVEAVESYGFLNGSYTLQELSTQQVNACDKVDGGCNGGNTETAYQYIHKAGGIETEADYPYTSGGGRTGICKFQKAKVVESIVSFTSITKGEDNVMKGMQTGPLSVCVAAEAFQTYNRGILKLCPGGIDHCVQAVGYDTPGNYWVVKNSWNTDWGEEGFIRLEMGKNICKIGNDATYPNF